MYRLILFLSEYQNLFIYSVLLGWRLPVQGDAWRDLHVEEGVRSCRVPLNAGLSYPDGSGRPSLRSCRQPLTDSDLLMLNRASETLVLLLVKRLLRAAKVNMQA